NHRRGHVVAIQRGLRITLAQCLDKEPRATSEVDDGRTRRQPGGDMGGEKVPEGLPITLRVGPHHALQECFIRDTTECLMCRHKVFPCADSALILGAPGSSPAPEATLERGDPRDNPGELAVNV